MDIFIGVCLGMCLIFIAFMTPLIADVLSSKAEYYNRHPHEFC